MQVRLSAFVASHLEAIQQKLEYERVSDALDLTLDSIKHQWTLNLQYVAKPKPEVLRLSLKCRHLAWMAKFGAERGISASAATNLVLSEHFLAKKAETVTHTLTAIVKPPETPAVTEEKPEEKPRGKSLLKSLKL